MIKIELNGKISVFPYNGMLSNQAGHAATVDAVRPK